MGKFRRAMWLPSALALIVLLGGVFVGRVEGWFQLGDVLGAAVATALVFCTLGAVIAFWQVRGQKADLDRLLVRMKEAAPARIPDWLVDDAELALEEAKVSGKEIWIISPSIEDVTDPEAFATAIARNVRRGITYTYILPRSHRMEGLFVKLERAFGKDIHRLRIRLIDEAMFRDLTVSRVAVFDPLKPRVFAELAAERSEDLAQRRYWIRLATSPSAELAGRYRALADTAEPFLQVRAQYARQREPIPINARIS